MVDLGLPSGLKWADRNVGAENIEDYGDYFMWGSTEPDTNNVCDWAHAPFNNGSSTYDSGYFKANSGTWLNAYSEKDIRLKPDYDAATQIMGGSWRMPTSAEIRELLDGTNRETGTVEGVNGMFFINKSDAAKRIFMPFAGRRNGSRVINVGSTGYAWSSSLHAVEAYLSHYNSFGNSGFAGVNTDFRYRGFAVRGVC